jgi:hypothetical protein
VNTIKANRKSATELKSSMVPVSERDGSRCHLRGIDFLFSFLKLFGTTALAWKSAADSKSQNALVAYRQVGSQTFCVVKFATSAHSLSCDYSLPGFSCNLLVLIFVL